jgi:predicted flap endonuclease-1-like 5' DNA nuclease
MSNINPWALLVLGILVGWILGWLLELWYFRRQRLQCQREQNRLEGQLRARNAELGAANSQISALRGELGARAQEIDTLLYQLATKEVQENAEASEPKSSSDSEGVAEPDSTGDESEQLIVGSDVDVEPVEKTEHSQNSLDFSDITPDQWTILRAAGITTEDDLAKLNQNDLERLFQAPEWEDAVDDTLEYDISPAAMAQPAVADDMTVIAGIGPKYATVLQENGITTFAQLGASDVTKLSSLFEASVGRPPDFQSWIDQARSLQVES